ncbi:MAG: sulfurtransferase TusA family protein [Hyphomicrobiales bacterium]|nr:sulfurtransferase TusA family protein [Hyphomicrobiales bacterium]
MVSKYEIDLIGYKCPIPILKIKKKIESLSKGDHLFVKASDPMLKIDLPLFCMEENCKIISINDYEDFISFKLELI